MIYIVLGYCRMSLINSLYVHSLKASMDKLDEAVVSCLHVVSSLIGSKVMSLKLFWVCQIGIGAVNKISNSYLSDLSKSIQNMDYGMTKLRSKPGVPEYDLGDVGNSSHYPIGKLSCTWHTTRGDYLHALRGVFTFCLRATWLRRIVIFLFFLPWKCC